MRTLVVFSAPAAFGTIEQKYYAETSNLIALVHGFGSFLCAGSQARRGIVLSVGHHEHVYTMVQYRLGFVSQQPPVAARVLKILT